MYIDILNGKLKLEELSREELIELLKQLLPYVDRVSELEKELDKLKNSNSRNTSLPPSRDTQEVKKKTTSLRRKSGRKSGGQKGHKGSTLELSEHVDHCIDYDVDECSHCGNDLKDVDRSIKERKQVLDIPPVRIEITEGAVEICPHYLKST